MHETQPKIFHINFFVSLFLFCSPAQNTLAFAFVLIFLLFPVQSCDYFILVQFKFFMLLLLVLKSPRGMMLMCPSLKPNLLTFVRNWYVLNVSSFLFVMYGFSRIFLYLIIICVAGDGFR